MHIRYLFTFGRRQRLEMSRGEYPTEMLYGLPYLRDRGYEVDYWEQNPNKKSPVTAPLYLRLMDRLLSWVVGTGSNASLLLHDIENIRAADVVVAQPDSVAIGAATLHMRGYITTPIVGIFMGLADRLSRLRTQHSFKYRLVRNYYENLLSHLKSIVVVGKGEEQFLREVFPAHLSRIHFLPFGIDTDYWHPAGSTSPAGPVLFIGIDQNRDFPLVLDIARTMPDRKFIFVSSRIKPDQVPINVELHGADWRRALLSDDQMRDLYRASAVVILPIRPCLQPSGQSVALQAMACGTPVIMSRTEGLWDPEKLQHEKHLLLIDRPDAGLWRSAISRILTDMTLRSNVTEAARNLVEEQYSAKGFAERIAYFIQP